MYSADVKIITKKKKKKIYPPLRLSYKIRIVSEMLRRPFVCLSVCDDPDRDHSVFIACDSYDIP